MDEKMKRVIEYKAPYELAKGQESIGQALKVDFGDTASMKSNQEDN